MESLVDIVGFFQEAFWIVIEQGQAVTIGIENVATLFRRQKPGRFIIVDRDFLPFGPVPVGCPDIE